MVSNASTARHAVWAVFGQGAGQMLSLVSFLVIARFVSQESFGLVAVSIATIEIVRRVVLDPVTYALTAKTDITERDYNVSLTLLAVLGTVTAAAMFALAGPLTALIGSPGAARPLHAMSVLLLAYGLSGTHGSWLARHMRFRALAMRSTGSVIAGGAIGIVMAINGFEYWSLVGQQLAISAISLATLWVATDWTPRLVLRWRDVVRTYHAVRHISLSAVWTSIGNDADLFFASAWFGPAVAGIYNAAKRIMLSANLILVQAISAVTLSAFANLEHDHHRRKEFRAGLAFTSAVTAPAFGGLAVTAPEIVHVILGPRWAAVAPILAALSASGYLLSLGIIATSVLLVARRTQLDSLSSAVAAAANVLTFLAVVRFGPIALAITVSATALIVAPMRLGFALRVLDGRWSDIVSAVAPSTAATAAMLGGVFAARDAIPAGWPPIAALALLSGVGVVLYLVVLRLAARPLFDLMLGAVGLSRDRRAAVAAE
ncbi:MAG: oligosaccharide flippase family protein [Sphingomonas sp.]